jgi:hypothetical protein
LKHLKDLTIAIQRALKDHPEAETKELTDALNNAVDFMTAKKAFEYVGEITCTHTAIKLVQAEIDLDDVLRGLSGKRTDIKLDAELYLVVQNQPEPADESKAAA